MRLAGVCQSQAAAGSTLWWRAFFSTPTHKLDLVDAAESLLSSQQHQIWLDFWNEGCHNRGRRLSMIGYLSPIDYEEQFITARTLTTARP